MSRIRSKNTEPEMILRRYLHRSGFRYRIRYTVYGKPDLVFPKNKIAIFIHGCFWHSHGCKNSVIPKTNTNFWNEKLNKNIQRDKQVKTELKKNKWIQRVIWECDLERDFQKAADRLADFLYKKGVKSRESYGRN